MSRYWQHRDTGVLFAAPDETEHAGTCDELSEAVYRQRKHPNVRRGLDLFGGDA